MLMIGGIDIIDIGIVRYCDPVLLLLLWYW